MTQETSSIASPGAASAADPAAGPATAPQGWPWARIARPAAIATESGAIDASGVAAVDFAVLAARDALAEILGRPLQLRSAPAQNAPAAPQGFGVVLRAGGVGALVMLDPAAARLMANALAMDQGGAPGSAAPGPIADLSDVDKGLIEYLSLSVIDRVLRSAHPHTQLPIIESFCDGTAAAQWLQSHKPLTVAFELAMSGSTGVIGLHLTGLNETQAATLVGCLGVLDWSEGLSAVNVALALPAITLQPEEFAGMQAGDVLLLGAPSLKAMPLGCELVTDTHWSLGKATVTHDTPTYLTLAVTPTKPAPRSAALRGSAKAALVQPLIGFANETIDKLRAMRPGDELHLAKDPVAPAALYHGPRRIAEGELVVIGSELGLRLLKMT